jgi:hypothetical protein
MCVCLYENTCVWKNTRILKYICENNVKTSKSGRFFFRFHHVIRLLERKTDLNYINSKATNEMDGVDLLCQ